MLDSYYVKIERNQQPNQANPTQANHPHQITNIGTWHVGPLFNVEAMDFYNLELSNTNVRDILFFSFLLIFYLISYIVHYLSYRPLHTLLSMLANLAQ